MALKITQEISDCIDLESVLSDGANKTLSYLTREEEEDLLSTLEEHYPDGIDLCALDDIIDYEPDFIAELLGYVDFDQIITLRRNIA